MIIGHVNTDREAIIHLEIRGPTGLVATIETDIDTGFDGWLTLPPSQIAGLGLTWRSRGRALLADGSESIFDSYEGIVIWDGQDRRIIIDEAETTPLAGMALLSNCELRIEVRPSGRVEIQPLP